MRPGASGALRAALLPAAIQAGVVAAGLAGLAIVSQFLGAAPGAQTPALVVYFGVLYAALLRVLRNRRSGPSRWSAASLLPALAALAAGTALHVVPVLVADPSCIEGGAGLTRALAASSPVSIAGTCAVVLWEELWFRGPVHDTVPAGRASVAFAAINGLLFAALHLLNPRFDPLVEGPELLFAGTLLSLVYFASGSFLVPLALHVGNNLAAEFLRGATGGDPSNALDAPKIAVVRSAVLAVAAACAAVAVLRRTAPER